MLRTTLSLIVIGLFFAAPFNPSYAQTADEIKARNYVFAAEADYKRRKYEDALDKVEKAESTLGRTGELPLKIKVQSLYALERYSEAKVALDALYTYSPSEKTQRAVSSIFLDLEERMDAIRAADAERAKQKAAQEQALTEQKIEAERLEAKMRYEATVAQAEAVRLAPLIAAETAKKTEILSTPGVQRFNSTAIFSAPRGADWARGSLHGIPGVNGGTFNVFTEEIEFEHVDDLVLLTVQNTLSGRTFSGYWDTGDSLELFFKGGDGRFGLPGERGPSGTAGKDATIFGSATRGGPGGNGTRGGNGGDGGTGGSIFVHSLTTTDSSDWKNKWKYSLSGGKPGKGGEGGKAGRGGIGGFNIYGTEKAGRGRSGYKGSNGNDGNKGAKGSYKFVGKLSPSQYREKGIKLHSDSGPVISAYTIEQVKDLTIDAIVKTNDAARQQAVLTAPKPASATADRDAQPLVRIPPIFPPSFLQGDHSGYCRVKFDINTQGQTFNITTTECTDPILADATIKSVQKWRYNPKILDGRPSVRPGVASKVMFALADERGNALPMPKGYQ